MKIPKTLALILAGGAGNRLKALTERRAKPALPFGGSYRLIDIPLSNLLHSGLSDVWIVEQFRPHSLNDHLANGRPWDLDRTHGGLRVLPPYQGQGGEGFAEGNADALFRQREFIREFAPELVLVLSADHLYTLDYRAVIETHLGAGAVLTMVTTEVEEDASRFGVVEAEGGLVTGFEYKPEKPRTKLVAAEVFLYDTEVLLGTLEQLAHKDEGLSDYGHSLIPHLVKHERVAEHRLDGYWRDVGTLESYWTAHMELLSGQGAQFDDPVWPILTSSPQRLPAFIRQGAAVEDSLIAPGAQIAGRVVRSVVGPGTVIEAGATVTDSVLLHDVQVAGGARLERVIADTGARVGPGAQVGGEGDLTLLGMNTSVAAETTLEAGAQVAPV